MTVISRVKGKLSYLKRGITLFVSVNGFNYVPSNDNILDVINYKEFSNLEFLRDYYFTDKVLSDYKNRFSKGEILCVLEKDKQIISLGWINPNSQHTIGELAIDMSYSKQFEMLYNFETRKEYRGQGLYPFLLNKIVKRNQKCKLIYALTNNTASIKGIKKAGFKKMGNVYGFHKNKVHKLIKKHGEINNKC